MARQLRKVFSPDFKREAVRLFENSGKEIAQLARELGVRRNQLYKWQEEVKQYGDKAFPGHGKRARQKPENETRGLKAELKQLREENEILKKAALYFARECG